MDRRARRHTHLSSPLPWNIRRSRVILSLSIGILDLNHDGALWLKPELALHIAKIFRGRSGDFISQQTLEITLPVMCGVIGKLIPR